MSRSTTVLAAAFLVLFVSGGSRFAIGLTLKPMAEDLGWSRSTLGLTVAVFFVVSATCMFLAGRLADRYSLRFILGGGLAICAVGIGLTSLVTAPWQAFLLYGVIFAIGSGAASLTPIGVMVSRWFPGRTGLANAVAISGISVGQLLMIAVLAAVLAQIGWRSVYGLLGMANLLLVPVVVAAIATGRVIAADAATFRHDTGLAMRGALRSRHFWLLAVVYAICGFQDFFVATHVVAFATDRGVETLFAGNLLALMGLTGLVGVLAAGAWSDRSGPVSATLACFALRIVIFCVILLDQSTPAVAAFALLYGSTFLVTAPLTVIFVRDAFGMKHLGALSGLITMIHHICGGLGAFAGAALFDTEGNYDSAFVLMLILSVAAMAVTWCLRVARPPTQSD